MLGSRNLAFFVETLFLPLTRVQKRLASRKSECIAAARESATGTVAAVYRDEKYERRIENERVVGDSEVRHADP